MKRFSIEGSGAQVSKKVTLKHAHSSRFAHPTATFDPSTCIHSSSERPTHWCQNIPNPPRGPPKIALARNVSPDVAHPGCCGHMTWSARGGGDWAGACTHAMGWRRVGTLRSGSCNRAPNSDLGTRVLVLVLIPVLSPPRTTQ
jgi:hypothetical protein